MLSCYKMMHKFSYEHNIEHNRSKIRTPHPKNFLIIGIKFYLEPNYANLVNKDNKIIYKMLQNCSIHGHEIEHNRQFF